MRRDFLARQIAARNVDVLRLDVDVPEEIHLHEAVVALQCVRRNRVVFVEIERHHLRKIEAFAVQFDQLTVHAFGRRTRGKPEHRVGFLFYYFGQSARDRLGQRRVIVMDDQWYFGRIGNHRQFFSYRPWI